MVNRLTVNDIENVDEFLDQLLKVNEQSQGSITLDEFVGGVTMKPYLIFYEEFKPVYPNSVHYDLRDVIMASSPIEACKKFIIENKGAFIVHFVREYQQ